MGGDTAIFLTICTIFIALGAALPFMESEYSSTTTAINVTNVGDTLAKDIGEDDTVSIWAVTGSIISMFFWTFGSIPWWLDAFMFLPLRFTLVWLVARGIRGVGG